MLEIAFSPCPNDTFLFCGWVNKLISSSIQPKPVYADIEQLNQWALEGRYPLTKLSYPCLQKVSHLYQLLPMGSALGFGGGPKLISKNNTAQNELKGRTIAIPGSETTAHFLLNKFFPNSYTKHFCLYHEVIPLLLEDKVDAGVVIHESRFIFSKFGLKEIADLGSLWHAQYSLPLPLGALAIRKDLSASIKQATVKALKDSLAFAKKNPTATQTYMLHHSQEKELAIIEQHIAAYVTADTENLSKDGLRAIETLLGTQDVTNICYLNEKPSN